MGHVDMQATGEVNPVVTNNSKTHGIDHMLHVRSSTARIGKGTYYHL